LHLFIITLLVKEGGSISRRLKKLLFCIRSPFHIDAVALILLSGTPVIAELERKTDELTEEKPSDFET